MTDAQEIEYGDGSYRLIRPPALCDVQLIEQYVEALHDNMDRYQIPQWPPELSMLEWYAPYHDELQWPISLLPEEGMTLDEFCWLKLGFYYRRIGEFLVVDYHPKGFDWIDGATLRSLHEFFVATDLVQHWEEDREIPGISKLRLLLGHRYPEPGQEIEDIKPLPSGDKIAGIIANLCMGFQGTSPQNWLGVDASFATAVLMDANELHKRMDEKSKKDKQPKRRKVNPPTEGEDRADFAQVKKFIVAQLEEQQIEMPKCF